jgi:Avidin family
MTKLGSRIFLALGILLLMPLAASAQVLPSFSTWENQRTSTLSVGFVNGDHFDGWFVNRAAGFQCQNIPYPVTGTILPNGAITFTVNFTNCETVTYWKGRVTGSQMPTSWILYYKGIQRMTGNDLFKKIM